MKSLEILDDIHLDLENYLDYLDKDLEQRIKNNESEISINEVNDARAIIVTNMYYGFNQIKQDLEVLDIIKKKRFNIDVLKMIPKGHNNEEIVDIYNQYEDDEHKITLEELLKLKQWLEENENGN